MPSLTNAALICASFSRTPGSTKACFSTRLYVSHTFRHIVMSIPSRPLVRNLFIYCRFLSQKRSMLTFSTFMTFSSTCTLTTHSFLCFCLLYLLLCYRNKQFLSAAPANADQFTRTCCQISTRPTLRRAATQRVSPRRRDVRLTRFGLACMISTL